MSNKSVNNGNQFAYPSDDVNDQGMTKREHFAALAMQGVLANPEYECISIKGSAKLSVEMADALLEKLDGGD